MYMYIFVYSKLVQTIAVKISNIEETTYYTHQARYFTLRLYFYYLWLLKI